MDFWWRPKASKARADIELQQFSTIFSEAESGQELNIVHFFNVHLKELNCLLVDETGHLGVVLGERDGSVSPKNYLWVMLLNSTLLGPNFKVKEHCLHENKYKGVGFANDGEFVTLNVPH